MKVNSKDKQCLHFYICLSPDCNLIALYSLCLSKTGFLTVKVLIS